jgi:Type II intron maturase
VIKAKYAPYLRGGKPAKQQAMQNGSEYSIVATFGSIYRGIVQYYLLAGDVFRLHRLRWVMETSMLKTLAGKHRSTVSKMATKHKAKIDTPNGPRTCFEARIHRDGRQPLVARFGGIPLQRQRTAKLVDRQPVTVDYPHKELVTRLLADTCELCRATGDVQVHQIRKLTNLDRPVRAKPDGPRSWQIDGARPSWSAPPATITSMPGNRRSRSRSNHWRAG